MILLYAILLALSLSSPAFGAIAEVNAPNERDGIASLSGSDDFTDLVLTNGVTVGDHIFVGGTAYDSTSGSPASIAVTAPCGTFDVRSSSPTGATRQFIAHAVATSTGACTVRVDPDGTIGYQSFGAVKFTGVGALDVDDGGTTDGSSIALADITTVAANAIIFAALTQGTGPATITPDGSITEIAADDDFATVQPYAFAFRIVTTPGSYDMEWGFDGAVSWKMHIVSFAPAGAATGARRRVVTP